MWFSSTSSSGRIQHKVHMGEQEAISTIQLQGLAEWQIKQVQVHTSTLMHSSVIAQNRPIYIHKHLRTNNSNINNNRNRCRPAFSLTYYPGTARCVRLVTIYGSKTRVFTAKQNPPSPTHTLNPSYNNSP